MLDELLKRHQAAILDEARRTGVLDVRVFGSRARGTATAGSDLDLLVRLESGRTLLDLIRFKLDLEELLGCEVDVVTESALSPYLRDEVLGSAWPLEAA